MKKATKLVFDQAAFSRPQPEMVTRRVLLNGKYARVSQRKLAPGEKRRDPVEQCLEIGEEIRREEAEAARISGGKG
ncbi:MAG: hypothetical protein EOO56_16065 [Hymenobacter sp.]|nr:MAG: hypothetical protein EOO56_16065 [Hymenobacter sp.]